jgi:hypothetical protein
MTKHYEDWADWAGDHPEQAEADLRRDRERAVALHPLATPLPAGGYPHNPERLAEHRRLAEQATPDRDGNDSARMYSIERTASEAAAASDPTCETEGHEYSFGICLDCNHVDPAFEPDDDLITRDYLRGYDKQAAA